LLGAQNILHFCFDNSILTLSPKYICVSLFNGGVAQHRFHPDKLMMARLKVKCVLVPLTFCLLACGLYLESLF